MKSWAAAALALIWSAPAGADVLLGADIKGVIYEDGAAPVKVLCKAKDGARLRSDLGETAVDPAIALQVGPGCPLHALLGDGPCLDLPLERSLSVAVVRKKSGAASHLQVLGRQTRDVDQGPVPVEFEYSAAFGSDTDTGELVPPLTKVVGRLIVPPRPDEPRFFVGEFKASKPPPLPRSAGKFPYFNELLNNTAGGCPRGIPTPTELP